MNRKTVQVCVILLLIIGCSPEPKQTSKASDGLIEPPNRIDESALEHTQQAEAEAESNEIALMATSKNNNREYEEVLLKNANTQKQLSEQALLEAHVKEEELAEQWLLKQAKEEQQSLEAELQ
jgi:hypothetical protein